jgi:hypothetical protein
MRRSALRPRETDSARTLEHSITISILGAKDFDINTVFIMEERTLWKNYYVKIP